MAGWLAGRPDDLALTDPDGSTLTYAQLARAVAAVQDGARARGIREGQRVAFVARPDLASVVTLLGLLQHTTVVPLAPDQTAEVTRRVSDRAMATQFVRSAAELLPDGVLAASFESDPTGIGSAEPDRVALLLPTSGTTATARLVPVTVRMLTHGAGAVASSLELGPGDRGLHTLPLQHVGGIVDLLLAPLSRGGSVHLAGPFDAARCWEALPEATWWQAAPAMLAALLDTAPTPHPSLPRLRFVRSVSAPLPAPLRERAESSLRVPVVEIYGMTETAGVIASQPLDDCRPGSVGRPVALDVRILDGFGARAAVGEVQVRGPQVLAGYDLGPGQPLDRSSFDGDWLRTGDIGRLDADGHIHLVGRVKDMVNHGGEKIAPADVDEVMLTHPAISDAAAFGVPHPTLGEVVAAVVVLRPGAVLDLATLQAHVSAALPRSHTPRRAASIAAVPRRNGKLARADLPALLEVSTPLAATSPRDPDVPLRTPTPSDDARGRVRAWLMRTWSRALDLGEYAEPSIDADFFAAGGDSLRAAAIVAEVGDVAGELVYVMSVYQAPTIARYERMLAETYPRTWALLAGTDASGTVASVPRGPAVDDAARAAFGAGLTAGDVSSWYGVQPAASAATLGRLALIASAPRSGSTLLRAMLAGHPGVFAPPELYLLPFATMRLRRAAFPDGLASQLEGLERAWVTATGCDVGAARAWVRDLEDADASTVDAYGLLAAAVPGRLLVDKTPMNALRLPWLTRAMTIAHDLRVIHLVRHPAAVAESFAEARLGALWWQRLAGPTDAPVPPGLAGDSEVSFGELLWCRIEDVIDQLQPLVPEARWTQVRFEELVADPRTTAERVCAALGVPWDDDIAARVLDPYADPRARMTDGLHPQSRMIGDPKFAQHGQIDADRGTRGAASNRTLAPATQELAARRGYVAPERSMTAGQRRLWRLARLAPEHAPHVVPLAYRLDGVLDLPRLEAALGVVIARHDILRTSFPAGADGEPSPVVHPAHPVVVPVTDLTWVRRQNAPEVADAELARQVRAEVGRHVDVERGPLWRARLLRVGPDEALLVLAFHRLVFDGASRAVLESDLAQAFDGQQLEVAPPALEVAASLVARARARVHVDEAAWDSALDGLQEPTVVPVDRERGSGHREAVSAVRDLPPDVVSAMTTRASAGDPSVAAWWLAAAAIVIYRRTGQRDLVLQVPTAGRTVPQALGTIGGWSTLVPARIAVAPDAIRAAVVAAAQAALVLALDHDGLPREEILRRHPLAAGPVVVSVQHRRNGPMALEGIGVQPYGVRRPAADADLAIHLEVTPGGAHATVDGHGGLLARATLSALLEDLVSELRMSLADPSAPVGPCPAEATDDVRAVLRAVDGVADAAVVHDPAAGRLDAVVVLSEDRPADRTALIAASAYALPAYRVPARLRAVDALPSRPDGSLDLDRVRELARAGDDLDVVAAPSDELEETIARAWQDVLWRDEPVDVRASFRDYGGHSLLAVQLVVELEQRMGRPLPSSALAHLDTVAGLARALRDEATAGSAPADAAGDLPPEILSGLLAHTATWDGDRHRADAVIVGRNTAGSRTPLFWCLQNEREHRALADALGPDQPVHAMRSGNRVMVKSDDNIELLAAHYLREIREIRPTGPYLIGGNCQAARIALRVARRLRDEGDDVPVLLLMEKFEPLAYDGPVAMLFGDRSDRNPFARFADPGRGYAAWYSGPLWIRQIQGAHAQFFTPENIPVLAARVAEHLAFALADGPTPPGQQDERPGAEPLAEEAYRASVAVFGPVTTTVAPGSRVPVDVVVRNIGPLTWPAGSRSALAIAACWRPADGPPGPVATVAPLPHSVEPGQEVRVSVSVPAPAEPGRWMLEVDVVDEGITWFSERGSTPWRGEVDVAAPSRTRLRWRR